MKGKLGPIRYTYYTFNAIPNIMFVMPGWYETETIVISSLYTNVVGFIFVVFHVIWLLLSGFFICYKFIKFS